MAKEKSEVVISNIPDSNSHPPQGGPVRIGCLPFLIFEELGQLYGKGEQRIIAVRYYLPLLVYDLNENHPLVGFPGALAFRQSGEKHQVLSLWSRTPQESKVEDEPSYVLKIVGGPQDEGVWALGSGTLMAEKIIFKFSRHGLNSNSPCIPFMTRLVEYAFRRANDPSCIAKTFWEKDPT